MWVDYPLKSIRGHFKGPHGNLAFTKLLVSHAPVIRVQSQPVTSDNTKGILTAIPSLTVS